MCQFLLTKTCRYKSRSEKDKNQETAKTNEPNKHEVHTFYVLHWLYFMTYIIFLRNRLLYYRKRTSPQNLYFHMRNHSGICIFMSWGLHFAAKDMSLCSFHMMQYLLHIPPICKSLLPLLSNSRFFERTITHLLAHFDALLIHFSIFYSLLIFQKSTEVWCKILQISNITKMVKLLNFGTAASSKINGSLVSGDAHRVSNAIR